MATAEQVRELVDELQRMSARVQAAEQAASAAASQAAAAQRQQVAQGGQTTKLVDTRGRLESLVSSKRARGLERLELPVQSVSLWSKSRRRCCVGCSWYTRHSR
eukprot:2984496-Amphidinium_carterae.1